MKSDYHFRMKIMAHCCEIEILRLLVEGFAHESIKPEKINQHEDEVEMYFKIDAESEFMAWKELNRVAKTVIDPALEKSSVSGTKIKSIFAER